MATQFLAKDSIRKPPPLWWRRLERAMLIAFIPAAVSILMGWKFENELQATRLILMINVGLVALIKGVGMMLSNGEEYAQAPQLPNTDESKGDVG